MAEILNFWQGLDKRSRVGLVAGAALIVSGTIALGVWLLRPDYQVLFSDLTPRDAAAMTVELERMKVPYQISDDGRTISAPKNDVAKTRMKLMSKDIPLHGVVGFELFSNADFGMTDFVQKVNYLRALQGELTRTILSLDSVQNARVHLAMPEQGLFKKAKGKTKASVTLSLKSGGQLDPEQILGIQRLVAASVPDIDPQDVTVIDHRGTPLSRNGESAVSGAASLDLKKTTEDYLTHKANAVLDRTLGEGEAVATVDATLNLDHGQITTEEILGSKASDGASGVTVRERQTWHDTSAGESGIVEGAKKNAAAGNQTIETDYQAGRRVEQTVVAPGTIKTLTVAVVVKRPMNDEQLIKIREVVSLAVGLNLNRGDAVAVYSLGTLVADPARSESPKPEVGSGGNTTASPSKSMQRSDAVPIALAVLAAILIAAFAVFLRRSRPHSPLQQPLSLKERELVLAQVENWLDEPAVARIGEN